MSQWEAILRLTGVFQEQAFAVYSQDVLPVEVRQYLATWIESQNWKLAARDPSLANVLFQNLFEHLDIQYVRFTESHELVEANSIRNFKLKVQSKYQENPQKLAELIRELLQLEKQILIEYQHAETHNKAQEQLLPMETEQQNKTEQRVNEAKERVAVIYQEVKFLEEQQEIFDFRYKTYKAQITARPTDPSLKKKNEELQLQLNELDKKRKEILDLVKQLLGLCETLLGFLQQELSAWLQRQRLSCIGASTNTCLKELESWVTKTVEVFFQLKRILRNLSELSAQVSYEGDPLKTDPPELQKRLLEMLLCLLQRSFVVHKQPIMIFPCKKHLVLKTSTQFSLAARFLVNLKGLGNMKVSYSIDKNPPDIKGYRRFNLLGPQDKSLEYTQDEGLAVEYKHLTLKEQRAGGGKGNKGANDGSLSVMEELHIITLKTEFKYEGEKLNIEATTLPFVVISNISQFVRAVASILWFNLLSTNPKDVTFFSNPPAAHWSLIANALSWQFSCCTKRGLNADQLQMLGKKLCGSIPNEDSVVTWRQFSKESMPRVSFNFWEWFDAILCLVKAHLERIWNDGYVMGFVSRSTEKELLRTKQQGTFLLRFSESMRDGGITCSWVDHNPDGTYEVRSVEPFTKKELSSIPLTEIIRNYQLLTDENIPENPLKFLYPNKPKDEAFGKYYEQKYEVNLEYQRYMTRMLIMVSERNVDDSQSSIASGTPQHFSESLQYGNEMNLNVQAEYSQNVTDLEDPINGMTMEELLINPGNDPMFSDQLTSLTEGSLESFNNFL
ncbi:signal transducer and activator of transcription 2 [Hyla sarda]|uniref:signal transducer and activator of transcription 2 n=1 Tax=Hyla sarda TaxID=327740 RepID=UPI0024C3FE20|nr:signal transducer and activator of transcription 2 [Hyla sarda]XP_056418351.1 signal transducer and activator of transcription 2 [Hyla sarda]XP_056418352.1 signal transducer and activator of transcription 2 [Hyla sarda]XP_056418354.1 signal transducer and activator of transcription 2 [Hyla sarda]XP_056418355.1 signal transducer and activator of transcription 2 [Hyla sarda]